METAKAQREHGSPGPDRVSATAGGPTGAPVETANPLLAMQSTGGNQAVQRLGFPGMSTPGFVLALQQTVGNQVTQRWIGSREPQTAKPLVSKPLDRPSSTPTFPFVQRLRMTFNPVQTVNVGDQAYSAAEVFVDDQEADGKGDPVKMRVFPPEKRGSKPVSLPRRDWEALRSKGVREPDVDPSHLLISGYQPINQPAFLNGGPSAQDVTQGLMGDCRIISALEALAVKRPELIRNAISPHDQAATYTIKLRPSKGPDDMLPNTQAAPVSFSITNSLPVNRLAPRPDLLYALKGTQEASPGGFALWPALFEKAFATMWGGYEKLNGALEKPVFFALGADVVADPTGKEGFLHVNFLSGQGNPPEWKNRILTFWDKGYAMTTTAQAKQHNYSIIRVTPEGVVVSDPNTLRNAAYKQRAANPPPYSQVLDQQQKPFASDDNASESWPILFTWEQFFGAFKWVYGAK